MQAEQNNLKLLAKAPRAGAMLLAIIVLGINSYLLSISGLNLSWPIYIVIGILSYYLVYASVMIMSVYIMLSSFLLAVAETAEAYVSKKSS